MVHQRSIMQKAALSCKYNSSPAIALNTAHGQYMSKQSATSALSQVGTWLLNLSRIHCDAWQILFNCTCSETLSRHKSLPYPPIENLLCRNKHPLCALLNLISDRLPSLHSSGFIEWHIFCIIELWSLRVLLSYIYVCVVCSYRVRKK